MRFIFLIVLLAVAVNWSPAEAEDQQELENAIKENEPKIKQKQVEFEKEKQGTMEASKKEEELKALEYAQENRKHKLRKLKGEKQPDQPTKEERQEEIKKLSMFLDGIMSLDKQLAQAFSGEKKAFSNRQGYKALEKVGMFMFSVYQSRKTQVKNLKEIVQNE